MHDYLNPSQTVPDASTNRMGGRVAAACAVLFAVSLFATVASVNVPHDATDAELLVWWQNPANRTSGLFSAGFAVCAAVLFAVMMNHVRLLQGSRPTPALSAFTRSMGAAFTALLLVSAALRGVIGHLVETMGQPLPGVDLLRFSTALNYFLLGVPVMTVLALSIAGVSAVALRGQILPRWLAVVGLLCAAVILVAVAAQVGAFAIPAGLLWALCLAVAIVRRPEPGV